MLEEVFECYNVTIGMVSNDIFKYGRPGEVLNIYKSRYDIEMNPERQYFELKKKLS